MTKPPEISGIWGAVASRREMEAGWVLASGGMNNADVGVPRLVRPTPGILLFASNPRSVLFFPSVRSGIGKRLASSNVLRQSGSFTSGLPVIPTL
jgi:hypothetical protein